jgi:predicted outer membrane repeat protein
VTEFKDFIADSIFEDNTVSHSGGGIYLTCNLKDKIRNEISFGFSNLSFTGN